MKRCPQCNRVDTDESLKFCRTDGATLIIDSSPIASEAGTAQLGLDRSEVHTSILPGQTSAHERRSTGPTAVLPHASTGPERDLAKPRLSRSVIIGIVAVVVIATGILGFVVAGRFRASGNNKAIESIAVLPFENNSGNADSEYLSDGLAESLIYRLSQLSNLKVSPRSSVFRYKGKAIDAEKIGNELGVDAVMSGRLTQRGDNLTISVDLIDVRNKKTLWGEQFERKMSDLLTTHSEISSAITNKLQVKLSGNDKTGMTKQYTSNNEAYQLYLQGRYFWGKRSSGNLKKATELLKAATQKDPNFALAYSGLADCYVVSYYYVGERPRELLQLAKIFAARAIQLDPTLAEPHATLAFASWLLDRDRDTAEKEFRRAIELNPNYPTVHHWYSRFLRGLGRQDEAFQEI